MPYPKIFHFYNSKPALAFSSTVQEKATMRAELVRSSWVTTTCQHTHHISHPDPHSHQIQPYPWNHIIIHVARPKHFLIACMFAGTALAIFPLAYHLSILPYLQFKLTPESNCTEDKQTKKQWVWLFVYFSESHCVCLVGTVYCTFKVVSDQYIISLKDHVSVLLQQESIYL